MSVNLVHAGAITRPVTTTLTTTSITDLLTGYAPTKEQRAKLASLSVVNISSTARVVNLFYYDGAINRQFWGKSVAGNDTAIVSDFPVALLDGWSLKAQGVGITSGDIIVTVILANTVGQVG